MGLLSLFGALSPNEDNTPNMLQRMSMALHPEERKAFELQRQQAELQRLAPLAASGDKSALIQLATIEPQVASALASFGKGTEKVQEIGGKLIAYDPSNPNTSPRVLYEGAGTPLTDVAKLKADLDAGRIDRETYDRKIAKEVAPTEKNYKQFQLQNAAYADRMVNAENLLGKVENQSAMVSNKASALGKIPIVGGYLENVALNDTQQLFRNAANDWIRAKLRKESGAAIGVKEMEDEYRTYFPMPGDSAEVIRQKAQLRKVATDSMIKQTSGAYDDMYAGQTPESTKTEKYPEGTIIKNAAGARMVRRGGKWEPM